MPKPNYILNQTLNINGKNIYVKVTGDKGSENDGNPFLLLIPGGPGFGVSEFYDKKIEEIQQRFSKNNVAVPHIIVFDPLGCGKSDKALDPDREYTVENFTEISAGVAEGVKTALQLPKMDLFVEGGSFGGLVTLALPSQRKQWVAADSPIRLWQITSVVNTNGKENREKIMDDLEKQYGDDPNYAKIKVAMHKLIWGELVDKNDFIQEVIFNLAPLYADKNKAILTSYLGRFTQSFPQIALALSKAGSHVVDLADFQAVKLALEGCDVEVLNHFFKHNFNDYDLVKVIRDNIEVYKNLAVCLVSGSEDHIANPEDNAKRIKAELEDHAASFVIKGKHSFSKDKPKLYQALMEQLYIQRQFNKGFLKEHSHEIAEYDVPHHFKTLVDNIPKPKPINAEEGMMMFSSSYQEARGKFLAEAKRAGYDVKSLVMSEDEGLVTDIAMSVNDNTKKLLIVNSGIHGVEGYFGSAVQSQWLSEHFAKTLPKDVGVVFVHASNPHAFANNRRVDASYIHNNIMHRVDPNRNFINFDAPLPANERYKILESTLIPEKWDWLTRLTSTAKLTWHVLMDKITRSLNHFFIPSLSGQYVSPNGMTFGGTQPSWTHKVFQQVVADVKNLKSVEEIAFIDLHSGIGDKGTLEVYPSTSTNFSAVSQALHDVKGVKILSAPYTATGALDDYMVRSFADKKVSSFTIEAGTKNSIAVFNSLRGQNWQDVYGQDKPDTTRSVIRSAFYPEDDLTWKKSVTSKASQVFDRVFDRLFKTPVYGSSRFFQPTVAKPVETYQAQDKLKFAKR